TVGRSGDLYRKLADHGALAPVPTVRETLTSCDEPCPLVACTSTRSCSDDTVALVPLVSVPDTVTFQRRSPVSDGGPPVSDARGSPSSAVIRPDGQTTRDGAAAFEPEPAPPPEPAEAPGCGTDCAAATGVGEVGLTDGPGDSRAKK